MQQLVLLTLSFLHSSILQWQNSLSTNGMSLHLYACVYVLHDTVHCCEFSMPHFMSLCCTIMRDCGLSEGDACVIRDCGQSEGDTCVMRDCG